MSALASCGHAANAYDRVVPQADLSRCSTIRCGRGAVGTRVASRPPHRPVLAAFPHTVPTSGTDNQALRLDVCSPALALALWQPRMPGPESGSWRAGPHSPWPVAGCGPFGRGGWRLQTAPEGVPAGSRSSCHSCIGSIRLNGVRGHCKAAIRSRSCGSPSEVAVSALMSALADSGRATGSAWVRVVP
jgi:hypothetical protein